jgi:hypothetical protein
MAEPPTVYELFGSTTLLNLERSIKAGVVPTAEELAAVLEANSDKPLPPWFTALLARSLRGGLHQRKGRPKDDSLVAVARFAIARAAYPRYLTWLQKRKRTSGLVGWTVIREQHWWTGPPHERAARIVTARWLKHMSWRAFLTEKSSKELPPT